MTVLGALALCSARQSLIRGSAACLGREKAERRALNPPKPHSLTPCSQLLAPRGCDRVLLGPAASRHDSIVPTTSPEQRSLPFPPAHRWVTQFLLVFNCPLAASETLCCYLPQAAYSRDAPQSLQPVPCRACVCPVAPRSLPAMTTALRAGAVPHRRQQTPQEIPRRLDPTAAQIQLCCYTSCEQQTKPINYRASLILFL